MRPAIFLLLQSVADTPPERIDLLASAATDGCRGPVEGDIVVCAARADPYRLGPVGGPAAPVGLPTAQIALPGVKAMLSAEAQAAAMPNGAQGKRAMVTVRVPF